MNRISHPLGGLASAVPCFALVVMFARAWIDPLSVDEGIRVPIARSATGVLVYLPVAFLSVLVPFPEFGVTNAVLFEVYPGRGGGVWERHPERAMAGTAISFAIMGVIEMWTIVRPPKKRDAATIAAEAG